MKLQWLLHALLATDEHETTETKLNRSAAASNNCHNRFPLPANWQRRDTPAGRKLACTYVCQGKHARSSTCAADARLHPYHCHAPSTASSSALQRRRHINSTPTKKTVDLKCSSCRSTCVQKFLVVPPVAHNRGGLTRATFLLYLSLPAEAAEERPFLKKRCPRKALWAHGGPGPF